MERAAGRTYGGAALVLVAVALVAPGAVGATPAAEAAADARPSGFELHASSVTPKRPLFDGRRKILLRYGYGAERPTDLEIRVVRAASGDVVRVWRERRPRPARGWSASGTGSTAAATRCPTAATSSRSDPAAGVCAAPAGFACTATRSPSTARTRPAARSARSAPHAAEGGSTRASTSWRTAARRSSRPAVGHLIAPPEAGTGERVRTGEMVGRVGQTGNARTTPCHLHFEIRLDGRPIDPEPALRRWDRWS